MPRVSVIIISYNMAKLISRAIQSVLDQTFNDFEILVVDDGSTDDTREVVGCFGNRIRYFYQENAGASAARNRGILAAQGEFIAFLDSDDYWVSSKLEVQVEIFDKNPRVGLVHAKAMVVNEHGEQRGVMPTKDPGRTFSEIIEIGAFFPVCSVMVRKECFIMAGIFNASVPTVEDIDMWIRVARHFDIYEIKSRYLSYYYREDSRKPRVGIKQYKSQVELHRRILCYEDIPLKAVRRKLAMFEYLLGIMVSPEQAMGEGVRTYRDRHISVPCCRVCSFFRNRIVN